MKISVITVCYNSAGTIDHILRSVREQTHGDIEHIMIDGGSNDNTLAVIKAEFEELRFAELKAVERVLRSG